jgi:hypothetical protein
MSHRLVGPRPRRCHRAAGQGGARATGQYPGRGVGRGGLAVAVALEHRRAHLARHAWAGVLDRQAQAGALTVGTNPDRSVLWGVPVRCWPAAPRRYAPPCLDPAIPSSKMRRLVAGGSLCASVTPPAPAGRRCRTAGDSAESCPSRAARGRAGWSAAGRACGRWS